MIPKITNQKNLDYPPDADQILRKMFDGYEKVAITGQFTTGLGGSWVLVVNPVKGDGTSTLPFVVKITSTAIAEKEWQAYDSCIKDKTVNLANIRGKPVILPHSKWGGVCYEMVGGEVFDIKPLAEYVESASSEDINKVMNKQLLEPLRKTLWGIHQVRPSFLLHGTFDRILPTNLLIEPQSLSADIRTTLVSPATLPISPPIEPGDYVRLEKFVVTKVDLQSLTVTLSLHSAIVDLDSSYIVRLRFSGNMPDYEINQVIEQITGKVIKTRASQLQADVKNVLGYDFNQISPTVTLPNERELPNPLLAVPKILEQSRPIRVGCIHGDFNLNNIIVKVETQGVGLIDFAEARQDYILHDLFRLETEIVTKLIAKIISKYKLPLEITISELYQHLHCETFAHTGKRDRNLRHPDLEKPYQMLIDLRQTARFFLFDSNDTSEYYEGLTVYLIGALKFTNLNKPSKEVAFWGAAKVQQLLEKPPKYFSLKPSPRRYWVALGVFMGIIITMLMLGIFFVSTYKKAVPPPTGKIATLISISPNVQINHVQSTVSEKASVGLELYQDDTIKTEKQGGVTAVCFNGMVLIISADTKSKVNCDSGSPNFVNQLPKFNVQAIPTDPGLLDNTHALSLTDIELAEANQAISALSSDTATNYLLAQLYYQQRDEPKAIAQLEQLISSNETVISAQVRQQLGNLYWKDKQFVRAKENYEAAQALIQNETDKKLQIDINMGLALSFSAIGNITESIKYLHCADELRGQYNYETNHKTSH